MPSPAPSATSSDTSVPAPLAAGNGTAPAASVNTEFLATLQAVATAQSSAQSATDPLSLTGIDAAQRLLEMADREQTLKANRRTLYKVAIDVLEHAPNAADMPVCEPAMIGACIEPKAKPSEAAAAGSIAPNEIRRKRALLIGNNKYVGEIPQLETPVGDVRSLGATLSTRFGYEVTVVENGTKAQITKALNDIASSSERDESVFVFYAGHGYELEDGSHAGYWLPVDSSASDPGNWISNNDVERILANVESKQILLVSDSCFSGTLTKQRQLDAPLSAAKSELLTRRAVVAMSSGDDEPVADWGIGGHSIFAFYLMKALGEVANDSPISLVFDRVRFNVQHAAPQTPQIGGVISAGHMSQANYLVLSR